MEVDLFSDKAFELLKRNYKYEESKKKKITLFPELGICLWGFGKIAKEGKIVIIFSKNRLSWYETFLQAE